MGCSLGLLAVACTKEIVRNRNVHNAEVDWCSAVSTELATKRLSYASKLAMTGRLDRCEEEAKIPLLAKVRIPYHQKMALFLSGSGEDPGDAPKVPDPKEWCLEESKKTPPTPPDLSSPRDLSPVHDLSTPDMQGGVA
jgi:hypothetical protein